MARGGFQVLVRLPEEYATRLRAIAEAEDRPIAYIVRRVVREYLAAEEGT